MIWLSNWIKVGAIWLADAINRLFDPYHEFTRPVEMKYAETLEEKAEKFQADLDHFWVDGIAQYNLPPNSGDQALWHGVYTAYAAIRYSLGGSLRELKNCVYGLRAHQRRGFESAPRLIRGYRPDGSFEDQVSNDQASGHLLGIYYLWKYGDGECRESAKDLINGLASELAARDYALVGADGKPTKHGKLIDGILTDPLRLTLCLAVFKMAEIVDPTFSLIWRAHYDRLASRFRPLIPYGKVRLWLRFFRWSVDWDKTYDTHRAAIHYTILCDLEKDHDLHRKYLRGLLRVWRMERKSVNPWLYYLVRRQVLVDPADLENCVKHLEEFTLEDKQYNVERDNSGTVESFSWGGHRRARQPIPRWKVGSQDFFWQRHLYSVTDWVGNTTGTVRHNGLDYLVAYYGLKSLRLI